MNWHPIPTFIGGLVIGIWCLAFLIDFSDACKQGPHAYTVESFTPDLTIRIQCSGECDLAAMIAEAREAVEK